MPRDSESSGTVLRALDILIALRDYGDLTVRGISTKIGLKRSTVHRLLLALRSRLFVIKNLETGRYVLGPRLIDLGHAASSATNPQLSTSNELRRLARISGETAQLAELHGADVVFQDCVEGSPGLHVFMPRGSHLPARQSAFGKVLLTRIPKDDLLILLEQIGRDEIERLVVELSTIERTGVAYDEDVAAVGACAVASPIIDSSGGAIASIGIQAPRAHVTEDVRRRLADAVRSAAGLLSVQLGYAPSSAIWDELASASISADEGEPSST